MQHDCQGPLCLATCSYTVELQANAVVSTPTQVSEGLSFTACHASGFRHGARCFLHAWMRVSLTIVVAIWKSGPGLDTRWHGACGASFLG